MDRVAILSKLRKGGELVMEVRKISLYTYLTLFASLFLCIYALGSNTDWLQHSEIVFWSSFMWMAIIIVGLTKIRKAVGLDIAKKKEIEA